MDHQHFRLDRDCLNRSGDCLGGGVMGTKYVNRANDEEIIDIVRCVMDNGTGKAETANEHILLKLMQIRGTPMTSFKFDQERVDFHYDQWKGEIDITNLPRKKPTAYPEGGRS